MTDDKNLTSDGDQEWKGLYKVGGAAAGLTAVFIPIQIIALIVWPPPFTGTVIDWFTLFQKNWLIGLLSLDLLFIVDYALLIPIVLALYVVLRRINKSLMVISSALFLIAIAAYFASNTSLSILSLSNQYAAATTDAQRSMLLAAGQAMLATYQGTAFHVSYILASIAGIIIGAVMLQSNIFSKVTAYSAILGNLIAFGLYIPKIGLSLAAFSGVVLWIWYILIARKLYQLGKL